MSENEAGPERHSEMGPAARALLVAGHHGILSTHSVDVPGYPFGSAGPFTLDAQGRPVILISELAQHTKNLKANPKASLIVLAGGDDIQAAARLTVLGDFAPVPADEVEALAERFYRFFPESQDFHKTMDFRFWVMTPVRLRFIAGFARIHWLEPERVLRANPFGYERESGIVGHMNEDHGDALWHYCAQAGIRVPDGEVPVMTGIDAEGMHLRIGKSIERIPFVREVATPLAAREILVEMARAGRGEVV